jgi:hypothetical protein
LSQVPKKRNAEHRKKTSIPQKAAKRHDDGDDDDDGMMDIPSFSFARQFRFQKQLEPAKSPSARPS